MQTFFSEVPMDMASMMQGALNISTFPKGCGQPKTAEAIKGCGTKDSALVDFQTFKRLHLCDWRNKNENTDHNNCVNS